MTTISVLEDAIKGHISPRNWRNSKYVLKHFHNWSWPFQELYFCWWVLALQYSWHISLHSSLIPPRNNPHNNEAVEQDLGRWLPYVCMYKLHLSLNHRLELELFLEYTHQINTILIHYWVFEWFILTENLPIQIWIHI